MNAAWLLILCLTAGAEGQPPGNSAPDPANATATRPADAPRGMRRDRPPMGMRGDRPDGSRFRRDDDRGGNDRGDRRGWFDRRDDEPMTAEQIERFMDLASKEFPDIHARLVQVRELDQDKFTQMTQRVARGPLRYYLWLNEHDPERAQQMKACFLIDMKVRELAERFQATTDPQLRDRLKGALREAIADRFDKRADHEEAQIRDFEDRIAEMKARLTRRRADRERIVAEELERTLTDPTHEGPPGDGPPMRPGFFDKDGPRRGPGRDHSPPPPPGEGEVRP